MVCEIGPGTGRFSRFIVPRIPQGQLHLVDHSPWMVRFLQTYFGRQPAVRVHLGDGHSLPFAHGGWIDLVFVAGTIVALKLGTIHLYAREFARVLKPGGVVVFDYAFNRPLEESCARFQRDWQAFRSRVSRTRTSTARRATTADRARLLGIVARGRRRDVSQGCERLSAAESCP